MSQVWLASALALGVSGGAFGQEASEDAERPLVTPVSPTSLVSAHRYEVDEPMIFRTDGKKAEVTKGWVLVLKVDLRLTEPRNAPDHLLFADGHVAQCINSGYRDGHLVVVVPEVDLTKATLFFGDRLLPDRVGPGVVQAQRKQATKKGLTAFSKKEVRMARMRGGDKVQSARDLNELWYLQADLIRRYAPAEREMADSLRPGRG